MTHVRAQRDERGAAAVEFGLVALVFFTLLFGIIQFGLWFWAWEATAHAAARGIPGRCGEPVQHRRRSRQCRQATRLRARPATTAPSTQGRRPDPRWATTSP